MDRAPYYIVLRKSNEVLLNFLRLNIVINNKEIYSLINTEPVIVPVTTNRPVLIATDGFHFTKPLKLLYKEPGYCTVKVTCIIRNPHLVLAAVLLILLYLLGFATGYFIIKLLSFAPIVVLLLAYYTNRKNFIRMVPLNP